MERSSVEIKNVSITVLCKFQGKCANREKCPFYHFPSIMPAFPCVFYFLGECCKKENCSFSHIPYEEIQVLLNQLYVKGIPDNFNINKLFHLKPLEEVKQCDPNYSSIDICENGINCEYSNCLQHHPYWLQEHPEFCVHYLIRKGNCDGVFCRESGKKHVSWRKVLDDKIFNTRNTVDIKSEKPFHDFANAYKMAKMIKDINEEHVVDLLIVIDCTGSMQLYIDGCKESIQLAIKKFLIQENRYKLRVGFVGYRDFDCREKQFSVKDFNDNIDEVVEFIEGVKAFGGGDGAENVKGAFEIVANIKNEGALQYYLDYHPQHSLSIILFADSPSHGKKYYASDYFDDDHPEEEGLERFIEALPTLCKKVQFTCVNLTPATYKMFNIFEESFKGSEGAFKIVRKVEPKDLVDFFVNTLTTTVQLQQTLIRTVPIIFPTYQLSDEEAKTKTVRKAIGYKIVLDHRRLNQSGDNLFKNFKSNIKFIRYKTNLKIDLANPILQDKGLKGSISNVYDLFDVTNNRSFIGKIKRKDSSITYLKTQPNSIVSATESEKEIDNSREYCMEKLATQAFSYYIAKLYRNEKDHILPIFYLPVTLFELENQFENAKFILAETKLDTFEKFTSNDNVAKDFRILGFSHYSYMKTNQKATIVDLQGQKGSPFDSSVQGYILTDPAVHSYDLTDLFAEKTNLGEKGIVKTFYAQHHDCNITICKQLNLKTPTIVDGILRKIEEKDPLTIKPHEKVVILCDVCSQIGLMEYSEYKKQLQDQGYIHCKECEKNCKLSTTMTCKNKYCKKIFERKQYYDQVNNQKLDRICDECQASVFARCSMCAGQSNVQKCQKDIIENEMRNKFGAMKFICANCIKTQPDKYQFLLIEMKYFNTTQNEEQE